MSRARRLGGIASGIMHLFAVGALVLLGLDELVAGFAEMMSTSTTEVTANGRLVLTAIFAPIPLLLFAVAQLATVRRSTGTFVTFAGSLLVIDAAIVSYLAIWPLFLAVGFQAALVLGAVVADEPGEVTTSP